jgi:hypothetical protein
MPTKSAIIANDILQSLEALDKSIKSLKGLDFYSTDQDKHVSKVKTQLSDLWEDIQRHYNEHEEEASTAFRMTSTFTGLRSSTTLENILSYVFMQIFDLESSVIYGAFFEDSSYGAYAWQLVHANQTKVNSLR